MEGQKEVAREARDRSGGKEGVTRNRSGGKEGVTREARVRCGRSERSGKGSQRSKWRVRKKWQE